MEDLKVGNSVRWSGSWGKDAEVVVRVERIVKTAGPHMKDGVTVQRIDWKDNFIVDLANGHWAYDYQLKPVILTRQELLNKTDEELFKMFYDTASIVGLVVENKYIDGIPKGVDKDVNDFYLLEDILEYPTPKLIPKKYRQDV